MNFAGIRFSNPHSGRRTWFAAVLLTALQYWAGFSLVVVPVLFAPESNESSSSKERCEELSLVARVQCSRLLDVESSRAQSKNLVPTPPRIVESQLATLLPQAGHRIAMDLLAPITC